jgi:hypothetical protein
MGSNNTDGNEAEYRDILCSALPVHLLLVLRLVCTVMFVVDEVEPGVSVSENPSRAGWTGTNMGKASVNNKG